MYSPVSSAFLNATRNSAKLVTVADIYIGDSPVLENVPVTGGSVSADANADIRRSATLDIINPARVSSNGGARSGLPEIDFSGESSLTSVDLLRSEISIRHGFVYSNGTQETVPVGRFLVWSATINYEAGDHLTMELYDRSKYLQQTAILRLYDFSGVLAQTAIQTLVTASLPYPKTVVFSAGVPNIVLPGGSTYDTDCLDAILQICDILGVEFFFDLNGNPICQPKKYIDDSTSFDLSVFTFNTGDEGNCMDLGRTVSREGVFNGVGVYGSQPDGVTAQPFGEAYDLNPGSRTFWQGPFGKAFQRIDRPELTTSADCYNAALAELNRSISAIQPAEFSALPNPALEPGDIVTVDYPDGVIELHLLDTVELDFDNAQMNCTTRNRNRTD